MTRNERKWWAEYGRAAWDGWRGRAPLPNGQYESAYSSGYEFGMKAAAELCMSAQEFCRTVGRERQ